MDERQFLQKFPIDLRRGIADYIFENILNSKITKQNDEFIGSIILAQSKFNKRKSELFEAGIRKLINDFEDFLELIN